MMRIFATLFSSIKVWLINRIAHIIMKTERFDLHRKRGNR